jgi:non-lysosomal glucosylceramidase
MTSPYDQAQLYDVGPQRSYDDGCAEVAFLLGGIGTGNVSVGARGQLRDWEIFGSPGKGNFIPNTFFAIWTRTTGEEPQAKVLESRLHPPFAKARGFVDHEVAGLPRFDRAVSRGEYPFFTVALTDDELPVDVSMESFTPFIPLNADDSGLPTAILRYRVANKTAEPLEVSVAGSMGNVSSLIDYHRHTWNNYDCASENVNEYRDDEVVRGLFFRPKDLAQDHLNYGTIALTTTAEDVSYKRSWLRGGWWDGLQDLWDDFRADGRLEPESEYAQRDGTDFLHDDQTGSLAISRTIEPGGSHTFEFQISWNFPNRVRSWSRRMYDTDVRGTPGQDEGLADGEYPVVRKRCARYADAWAVARYTAENLERLEGGSRDFHRAMFGSTLPSYVVDAVTATITVIRSNTCIWLEDGRFLAWEGCFDEEGCCEGSCTHVWNYAQSLAFLFPELERAMRRNEYLVETDPDGKMNFRSYRPWGMGGHDHVPAADGQLGTLVRLYREWRLSGDDGFLAEVWPAAQKTLDFAFDRWDGNGDAVLDRDQFNTYDISFHGPNSMVNSIFFAALRAGEELARHVGDDASAERYRKAFEQGSAGMDALLWGGSYYVQEIDDVDSHRYQYGRGCLADQVFGQTLAHVAGLGHVLPREHVAAAVRAVFDNNFLLTAARHHNTQRTYLLNDEAGLLLCTWPDGGRPKLPFPYSDEVWTGIEYQVAPHLIYEGYVEEGLTLTRAVRERHDGVRRNPRNEVECGHHYARSLASYGVLVALSGFECDLPAGRISFAPRIFADDFHCFFAAGTAWGIYHRRVAPEGTVEEDVEVLYGTLHGIELQPAAATGADVPAGA